MIDQKKYDEIESHISESFESVNQKTTSNIEGLLDFDELKTYFGYDYWPTDKICIKQPSIGNIITYGDSKFFSMVNTLCGNPTSFRLELWEMGIDWCKISDFDLFKMFIRNYTPEETSLLFGDLNFSWFQEYRDNQSNSNVLVYVPMENNDTPIDISTKTKDELIIIDEISYVKIVEYLRYMFNIHPKVEKAKGKATKEAIIWELQMNRKNELNGKKNTDYQKSFLLPLISACLNHPGFKYRKSELNDVGIVEFMDSVKRLQLYESATALMKGIYSGMVDTSKIKNLNDEINWMKDLS